MDLQSGSALAAASLLVYGGFEHLRKRISRGSNSMSKLDEQDVVSGIEKLKGSKYPAKAHNLRVRDRLLELVPELDGKPAAVFIAGEAEEPIKYSDQFKTFRQNRYFYYLSGCDVPGSSMLFDFRTEKLTLFLPAVDKDSIMWEGMPMTVGEAYGTYDVDAVLYCTEISKEVGALSGYRVYTTDVDNVPEGVREMLVAGDIEFFRALDESRMIKDAFEVELLRKACAVTDRCHLAVMSALPIEHNECHIEAEFTYHAMRQGTKSQGYSPICGSGHNCGTLHYVKNDEPLENKHAVLIDAGAEWSNYTADVTRCFPVNGRWTKEHREIYDTVLDMQTQVMERMAPGALWDDLHKLAHRVLIKRLLDLKIFRSEYAIDEIFDSRASVAFFPHGLGHLLGMDTHDVGGNVNEDETDPMLQYLRLRRPLQAGMVVTNEPGCYFNRFLVKEFLENHPDRLKMVNVDVMDRYFYVGGVRIEDDILITETGHENLTKVTSDPDEIEAIVTNGLDRGRV